MGQYKKVASTNEFDTAKQRLVEGGGLKIARFSVGDKYYAIGDTCTHRGGPLSAGMLAEDTVTCPWHGARFDVKTGKVLGPPASQGVLSYNVRVSGNDIEVEIPS